MLRWLFMRSGLARHVIDPNVILFANDAFYVAFNNRDINAMESLWSRHTPPVCIHPGWSAITDRNEIIKSWRDIFGNEDVQPQINYYNPAVLYQKDIFSVICFEQLIQGWLIATNNFVMEDGQARIFHHQASQCLDPPEIMIQPNQNMQ